MLRKRSVGITRRAHPDGHFFGPLEVDRSGVTSDWILPFSAAAIRGIQYVDVPLVLIRQHPNQKQRRYITDMTNPPSNVESTSASELIQFLYMIDTMDTLKARKLHAPDVVTAVDARLLRSILRKGFQWRTARNRLFSSGVRARWLPLE